MMMMKRMRGLCVTMTECLDSVFKVTDALDSVSNLFVCFWRETG